MALEVFWTKKADTKFVKILDYLQEEWGDRVTRSFVKSVYDFLEILKKFPEIGTIENRDKNIRGFTIVKQVNLFYKFDGHRIIVLDFFDNRQNPRKKRF